MDAGDTWTILWSLEGSSFRDECCADLTACEGGGSWHLAYLDAQTHTIRYSRRPQDLSGYWQPTPYVVDDLSMAASPEGTVKKGIAAVRTNDTACIAWPDARDNTPGDFDLYADFGNNTGLMADQSSFSELSGGTVHFTLNAGSSNAGRTYVILGGVTGYYPGTLLPGGTTLVPVNADLFTFEILLPLINTSLFSNFMGTLDTAGAAQATLTAPPVPGYSLITMHYAFILCYPFNWASNPVAITIYPG